MKKFTFLVLAALMLLVYIPSLAAPAYEKVIDYQTFDGDSVDSAFGFISSTDSAASLENGALVVSSESWASWVQSRVYAQNGNLQEAEGLIFHLERTGATSTEYFNFTCQLGDGSAEKDYTGSTLWYKPDGSDEWQELPFYGGWGSNLPADTAGQIYLPFDGFTGGDVDLSAVTYVQFWLNTYGAQNGSLVLDAMGGAVDGPVVAPAPVSSPVGYLNNTVCVAGPSFRDFENPITDKWYTFLPLDLSRDGVYSLPLIGGNCYVIGEMAVVVEGDNLSAYYAYWGGGDYATEDLGQYLNFFSDYAAVTADALAGESPFLFGKTYSISNDLGGDTDVLLYVCNRASFYDLNRAIERYNPNDSVKTYRAIAEGLGLGGAYLK
ncbi:MAG: hypothetical protein E7324_02250 [Clostridiales bacterium]|nr:hypothetical protein [Clostridiales bacterium]